NPKIEIIKKHIPIEILGDDKVNGIILENVDTKERVTLETDGIFPYIGADPNTSFVKDLGITDENGYILVNEEMETDIKGIYGAGDCNVKTLRQIVTATSDGAIAAQNAFHYIKG
ncbi:MAG: FAD-dependent oxidoreductase, partial [Bacillota bacterium]|nr:FAD-dependent oxidoreductase [Bacillota bacterium]